jgi:hypothetical protein
MSKVWRRTGDRRHGSRGPVRPVCLGVLTASLVAFVVTAVAAATAETPPQRRITLAFQDAAAADALAQFRWVAEVPIIFTPPPDKRISVTMMDVPLDAALTALCRQLGYEWRTVGQVYVLIPAQRPPLLPSPVDIEDRVLYPDRQRLDAARLVLTLTRSQIASLSEGNSLAYSELAPNQQDIAGAIYRRLMEAVRGNWIQGAQALASAPASPPSTLALTIRGYAWRLAQPSTPSGQPQPPPSPATTPLTPQAAPSPETAPTPDQAPPQ